MKMVNQLFTNFLKEPSLAVTIPVSTNGLSPNAFSIALFLNSMACRRQAIISFNLQECDIRIWIISYNLGWKRLTVAETNFEFV
jgi:hypothetical protein